MRSIVIGLLFFILSSSIAHADYICASSEIHGSGEIRKFLLIEEASGELRLSEKSSLQQDSLCTRNKFEGGEEHICLGSRFYFSLHLATKKFMVSFWEIDETKTSLISFSKKFAKSETTDSQSKSTAPLSYYASVGASARKTEPATDRPKRNSHIAYRPVMQTGSCDEV